MFACDCLALPGQQRLCRNYENRLSRRFFALARLPTFWGVHPKSSSFTLLNVLEADSAAMGSYKVCIHRALRDICLPLSILSVSWVLEGLRKSAVLRS